METVFDQTGLDEDTFGKLHIIVFEGKLISFDFLNGSTSSIFQVVFL